MKTLLFLSVVALFLATAMGLSCQTCMHQEAEGDEAEAQAKLLGGDDLWEPKCKAGSDTGLDMACGGDDADLDNGTMWVCYSFVGRAELSFVEHEMGADNTSASNTVKNDVDYWFRGCLNVTDDTTDGDKTDDMYKDLMKEKRDMAVENPPGSGNTINITDIDYSKEEYGAIKICSDQDACNNEALSAITGAASFLSATASLVVMATAVAYWNC